jgi:hypothetical protein
MHYLRTSADSSDPQYFSGIAFAEDCAVLSYSGLNEYIQGGRSVHSLADGRYSLCVRIEESVYFMTDRTGQDCWFYANDGQSWAVSNSFFALAEHLRNRGGALTLRHANAFMFGINHSSGDQPYCNNSMVEEVRILPRDAYVEIRGGTFRIVRHPPIKPIETHEEYIQTLRAYVDRWSSRLSSIISIIEPNRVRCDVSGGTDSRIILGLTRPRSRSGVVKYSSNKRWELDYRIAELLSAHYGFRIDNSEISAGRSLCAEETLRIFRYGNAGVYRNVYYPKHSRPLRALHLHGGGGENLRGLQVGSAWKFIHRVKQFFKSQDDFEKVKFEYLSWYEKNDVDPRSDESTIIHYRNFRGRFHFGRNWFRELVNPLLTPLSSQSAEQMSDYLISRKINPRVLQFDLLYMCDPFLAFFPFDSAEKAFRLEDVSESMHYLSGIGGRERVESIKLFGVFPGSVDALGRGDPDMVVNSLCHAEIEDYLSQAPAYVIEKFPWLQEGDRLRAYGFVSVLKLVG